MASGSESRWATLFNEFPVGSLSRETGLALEALKKASWPMGQSGQDLEDWLRRLLDLGESPLPPGGRRVLHRQLPILGAAMLADLGTEDVAPLAPAAEETFGVIEAVVSLLAPSNAVAATKMTGTQLRAHEPHEDVAAFMEDQRYEEVLAMVGVGAQRFAYVQRRPLHKAEEDGTGLRPERLASTATGTAKLFNARAQRAVAEFARVMERVDQPNPVEVTLSGVALPRRLCDNDAALRRSIERHRVSQVRLLELMAVLPERTMEELGDHFKSIRGSPAVDCPSAALAVLSALIEARDAGISSVPVPFDVLWPPGQVPVAVVWHILAEGMEAARRGITEATVARRRAVYDAAELRPPKFYDTLDKDEEYLVDVFTTAEVAVLRNRFRAIAVERYQPGVAATGTKVAVPAYSRTRRDDVNVKTRRDRESSASEAWAPREKFGPNMKGLATAEDARAKARAIKGKGKGGDSGAGMVSEGKTKSDGKGRGAGRFGSS